MTGTQQDRNIGNSDTSIRVDSDMNLNDQIGQTDLNSSDNTGNPVNQIRLISIEALKPHPDNPRIHRPAQVKQIAKSIQTFGFQFPILIDQNNQIIAGHGCVMACEQLEIKEVPTLCVDNLSDEKIRALMIADNKLTENGQ